MENKQIIEKILADTQALMTLKVDNEEVVKDKFRQIRDRVNQLTNSATPQNEAYGKASALIQAAMEEEYRQFDELTNYEQKEQVLIQLRHKAAEVCELLQTA
jgi:hypothetical protein